MSAQSELAPKSDLEPSDPSVPTNALDLHSNIPGICSIDLNSEGSLSIRSLVALLSIVTLNILYTQPAAPLCLSIRHYRRCRHGNSGFVSSALRAFEPESKEGNFTCCPHLRVLSSVSSSSQYAHFPLAALRTAVVVRSCTHPHRADRQ